jgi:hypothetical protein
MSNVNPKIPTPKNKKSQRHSRPLALPPSSLPALLSPLSLSLSRSLRSVPRSFPWHSSDYFAFLSPPASSSPTLAPCLFSFSLHPLSSVTLKHPSVRSGFGGFTPLSDFIFHYLLIPHFRFISLLLTPSAPKLHSAYWSTLSLPN